MSDRAEQGGRITAGAWSVPAACACADRCGKAFRFAVVARVGAGRPGTVVLGIEEGGEAKAALTLDARTAVELAKALVLAAIALGSAGRRSRAAAVEVVA